MTVFTTDDLMVVCMARLVQDGETVAQGLATPLVTAAYLLARRTHAPNLYFVSAIGQGMCSQPAPLNLARVESLWLGRSLTNVGFVRAAADILPSLPLREFFRPAQVDLHGNFNNLAFGKDICHPRLRLPGSGGIPDVTTFMDHFCLYVPRHSRLTFVESLDFCSGLGHNPARTRGKGPQFLISDLGLFDYANGRMRLLTYHPGVSIEQIRARTGFEFDLAPEVGETLPPTGEDMRWLEKIDPLGIRRLESMSGSGRREQLQLILKQEKEDFFDSSVLV